jgi:hypothetical protein
MAKGKAGNTLLKSNNYLQKLNIEKKPTFDCYEKNEMKQ